MVSPASHVCLVIFVFQRCVDTMKRNLILPDLDVVSMVLSSPPMMRVFTRRWQTNWQQSLLIRCASCIREKYPLVYLLFEWVGTKRRARESRAGARIHRFCWILEPRIRCGPSSARKVRYRAHAVPFWTKLLTQMVQSGLFSDFAPAMGMF